uniref:Uncharacterized protein n=1 Tax=Panagrolaimus davidi TaxID=227884 RepID=A0A914PJW4_9BILA
MTPVVTLDDTMPKLCTLKLSTLNSYDLSFQLDYMSFASGFLTIITSKTHIVIHPNVTPQKPCQGSGGSMSNGKMDTDFCCKT